MTQEYYTLKELAAKIGYSYWTVHEWVKTRNLPIVRSCDKGRITVEWSSFIEWWKRLK